MIDLFGEYLKAVADQWIWLVLGVGAAIIDFLRWFIVRRRDAERMDAAPPRARLWALLALTGLSAAQFLAWKEIRSERDDLQKLVDAPSLHIERIALPENGRPLSVVAAGDAVKTELMVRVTNTSRLDLIVEVWIQEPFIDMIELFPGRFTLGSDASQDVRIIQTIRPGSDPKPEFHVTTDEWVEGLRRGIYQVEIHAPFSYRVLGGECKTWQQRVVFRTTSDQKIDVLDSWKFGPKYPGVCLERVD